MALIEDAITKYLPRDGLIGKIIEMTEKSEICPRFRFFSFIGALGAAVNRKIYIQRGSKRTFPTLYPNPWIFLIAPQGKGKKSTSLRIGREILKALPLDLKPLILSAKLTPEVLVKTLSTEMSAERGVPEHLLKLTRKKAIATIISSELGVLLGKEKYLTGMAMLLTELYDCHDEWDASTIGRGDEKLFDVCLSVLAATTPDWMQTLMPKDAFEIGFMSRLVLVPQPKGWRRRVLPPEDEDSLIVIEKLFNEVVDEVAVIANLKGEMTLTEEAWSCYKKWYLNQVELPPGPQSEYTERKQDHALRIAALLQLAQTKSLKLDDIHYKLALDILSSVEPEVMELISYISMEPRMRIVNRVLSLVEFEREITEEDLIEEIWTTLQNPRELDAVMDLLTKSGQIKYDMREGKSMYKFIKRGDR